MTEWLTIEASALRRMLGHFATGVAVVTARSGDRVSCVTVNSFNSVSLDPALVLFSLHKSSSALPDFESAEAIGINILSETHRETSDRFASRQRSDWRTADVEQTEGGCLFIRDALARMQCRLWARYDGGDHRILVCRVDRFSFDQVARPLVFFRGGYASLSETGA